MSIIDLYLDMLCVVISARYAQIAKEEKNRELEDTFNLIQKLQIIFLQAALLPRYFMFLWTITGFGKIIPCRKVFLDQVFEIQEEENITEQRHRQLAGLFNICSDVLSGQIIFSGKGDQNDLSYQSYRTEKR